MKKIFSFAFLLIVMLSQNAQALVIKLDFSHDKSGFFAEGTEARQVAEKAAADLSALLAPSKLKPFKSNYKFYGANGEFAGDVSVERHIEFSPMAAKFKPDDFIEKEFNDPADVYTVYVAGVLFSSEYEKSDGVTCFASVVFSGGTIQDLFPNSRIVTETVHRLYKSNGDTFGAYLCNGATISLAVNKPKGWLYGCVTHELIHCISPYILKEDWLHSKAGLKEGHLPQKMKSPRLEDGKLATPLMALTRGSKLTVADIEVLKVYGYSVDLKNK